MRDSLREKIIMSVLRESKSEELAGYREILIL